MMRVSADLPAPSCQCDENSLQPPNGGIFLEWNDIAIKNHEGSDTEGFRRRHQFRLGQWRSEHCSPKIKQTIASAANGAANGGRYGVA
jgi:hypothetical protein